MAREAPRPAKPDGVKASPRFKAKGKQSARRRHSYVNEARSIKIFHALHDADDRTLAIVGTNLVEHQLVLALEKRLRKLSATDHNRLFDGENSALGRFHAKIQIGYALNLFNLPEYDELMRIKAIRNKFAHRLSVRSFNVPEIKRESAKLLGAAYCRWLDDLAGQHAFRNARTSRERFLQALVSIHSLLGEACARQAHRHRAAVHRSTHYANEQFRSWLETHAPQHLLRIRDRG